MNADPAASTIETSKVNEGPGNHAVATGVGAASAGAAGAAIGLTVAGPIGAMIGAVVGAFAGGVAGSAISENTDLSSAEQNSFSPYEPLMVPPTHEEIAERAWKYFEQEGKTDGHDFGDWVRAESDLYREALAARDKAITAGDLEAAPKLG